MDPEGAQVISQLARTHLLHLALSAVKAEYRQLVQEAVVDFRRRPLIDY